ncbi:hypothetical protein BN1723_015887 [Verticillium longisporum]|uniref:Major facilitator superfamily (MFS) profile domain-containing protein n=1 Tax=Verticillium longisporum TaxID=100787 RepID=A0A0G4LXF6_VERLO|nr:hypothetical protein BN1708_014625 [Verticillium longisporum]CRK41241.1 hypothetical protein BN1723_015887 [Verticillium longisporum]
MNISSSTAFRCSAPAPSLCAGLRSKVQDGIFFVGDIGCVLCILGVIIQSLAESAMAILGCKLVSTLGLGLGHVLAPVFVAEIAPDELRGVYFTLTNTMIVSGQWGCALVAYGGSFIASD